jgi:SET domain
MPYRFEFRGPQESFDCTLQCQQCSENTAGGRRCKSRVCIGLTMCWAHLLKHHHLRVLPSTIPGAGKGLFARQNNRTTNTNSILFKVGDIVCPYNGAPTTDQELQARYGNFTAPYGLQVAGNTYENAACHRGVGSLINHAPNSRANVRFSRVRVESGWKSVIRATKRIRDGSELFCNYGSEYGHQEPTTQRTRRAR